MLDPMSIRLIAVCGPSDATPEVLANAEQIGKLLAQEGLGVVCGGSYGVMEAVCRGAASEGGLTVGLLPGDKPSDCNAYVTVPIATGLGEMRNALIIRCASGVIAIGGSSGTLSEIGFAMKLGKTVVGLHTYEILLGGVKVPGILHVATPEEAVEAVVQRL